MVSDSIRVNLTLTGVGVGVGVGPTVGDAVAMSDGDAEGSSDPDGSALSEASAVSDGDARASALASLVDGNGVTDGSLPEGLTAASHPHTTDAATSNVNRILDVRAWTTAMAIDLLGQNVAVGRHGRVSPASRRRLVQLASLSPRRCHSNVGL